MTLVLKPHVASQMHEMKTSRLYFLWKDVLQSAVVIIEVILMIFFLSSFSLQSDIFDEIELSNLCYAECSIKNVNHSFQVRIKIMFIYLPFR